MLLLLLDPKGSNRRISRETSLIENKDREIGSEVIIAGNFNVKGAEYAIICTNYHDERVLATVARLDPTI